jgi:hypothetical protein
VQTPVLQKKKEKENLNVYVILLAESHVLFRKDGPVYIPTTHRRVPQSLTGRIYFHLFPWWLKNDISVCFKFTFLLL